MKYIIITIAIILIFLTLVKKDSNIQALTSQNSILAFGDSLTYGYSAKFNESYPVVLGNLTGLNVINAGINGETSSQGLRRLSTLLENKSIKLMILCFGGNDIIQRLPMDKLKKNLKTMIHMAKEKNIQVLLVSVPNFSLFGLSPLTLYDEVADEENIVLASGILADILSQPSLKSDQIHPNALGYKQMAEKIYESLKENKWAN